MNKDPYWDELGIAWVAVDPQLGAVAPLKRDLQRQSLALTVAFALTSMVCALGVLLGIATIGLGLADGTWNFVTRGIAVLLLATLSGIAAGGLSVVRRADEAKAVSEMIALSIRRARKWLLAIRLGLLGCVLAAGFGLIGTAIRIHFSNPPKMSPVVDLALLALVALALGLCHQRVKARLARFEYLQRTFAGEGPQS